MKGKIYLLFAAAACATLFSSCTKFYACECTDYKGNKTQNTVTAKTKVEANKNCADLQTLGNCTLSDKI